jgi:Tfp pilus assembly protein PilX
MPFVESSKEVLPRHPVTKAEQDRAFELIRAQDAATRQANIITIVVSIIVLVFAASYVWQRRKSIVSAADRASVDSAAAALRGSRIAKRRFNNFWKRVRDRADS